MKTFLFSDASFDPRTKQGVGAILILNENELSHERFEIQAKPIAATTVARAELMAALWGLEQLNKRSPEITLLTDCRNIVTLPSRRQKLEADEFKGRASGKLLANADLYRAFFAYADAFSFSVEWIKGHSPQGDQNERARIFSAVDKRGRQLLRELR